ncbi:unnamed protein product [Meloidogyne enterolobii]|uniref:Uncharacterized protein n=1 Tax=Meloidogyne enterolobii TaxID=390850 RepID=A0ACB0Y4C5_MELEN
MSSPTHNCCHPKQQQPQTTAGELASVMQELRQRFNKPTNPNDVPVQPVQKKEQKKQRSYLQRRNAFRRKCKKRLGCKIHSPASLFKLLFLGDIFSKIEMCSETELLNDWNKFPKGKLCDCSERFRFWPDCFYGRQHTKSCPSLFVYSPRLKKLAVKMDPETLDFLKNKSKRETMKKLDDKEKSPKHCDEAIDQPACSDQHLAELDPKQQQLQTTTEDLTSVMQELRQRFDNRTTAKDVPTQSVQKEEQKEQLSFFQRREAFWKECLKRLGWGILGRVHLQSAPELRNDRKKFPKEEWCDRPSSQYNCSFGCQHTKSCEAFFEFTPEYMKHIAKVEAITGHRGPTFSTKKSKQENVEECDADEKSLEGGNDRPSCSSRRLIARSYDYLTPTSLDAVAANFRSDRVASNLTSSSDDYFGQSSENFSLEPLLGSLEDVNPTETCLPTTMHKKFYFLEKEWCRNTVSVADVVGSWERVNTMNTMEELDPEKWQLLEYSVRPFASLDDFFTMSSASSGNDNSLGAPVSVPTITRSASTGDFEDMESVPSSIQSSVSFLFSPPEARETVSLQTTIQKESYFLDEDWGLDFVSVADVVGSWERVNTMHTMEELAFFTGSTCTDDVGTSTSEDMKSVPSSIQSSVSLLSPLEAREKVRKLALQANNVDDFFELIPDDLLDNFFSDYKMLVRHKMLEEQCDNIREELMKQPKKADD